MSKTICIYHKGCIDGFGAAWVVWNKLNDVEFHPGIYQSPPPDVEGKDVILVDFSYKRQVMDEIIVNANSVLIIDHHKTAETDLMGIFDHPKVDGIFDMEKSGAVLAWEWFYPGDIIVTALLHIQDRDLWRFDRSHTKEVCAALYSYEQDFDVWTDVIYDMAELVSQGKALVRQQERSVKSLIGSCAKEISFQGHNVLAANIPYMFASDAGNEMAKDRAFSITFYYGKDDCCTYSLRSDENGLDVSEIAFMFGGGGHKHAAGFKLNPGELLEIDAD